MSLLQNLDRQTGVVTGDDVLKILSYARDHEFAIPAINVSSSSAIIAALEAARDKHAPIILELSHKDSLFFAGQAATNDATSIAIVRGAIAAAHFIRAIAPLYGVPVIIHTDHCPRSMLSWLDGMLEADQAFFEAHGEPLFSSHMVDFNLENVEWNIQETAKYMIRMKPLKLWLEMEIGSVGEAAKEAMIARPEDILRAYQTFSAISPNFSMAVAFGNVHGVYATGSVKLQPQLLGEYQSYVKTSTQNSHVKPLLLVFHGGSGSSDLELQTAIQGGVVKVNVNTDTQFMYMSGIRDFMNQYKEYLENPVGNPEGQDVPNKKYYDTRIWVRKGEERMAHCVGDFLDKLNATGQL